jgi:hypothetical protein
MVSTIAMTSLLDADMRAASIKAFFGFRQLSQQ